MSDLYNSTKRSTKGFDQALSDTISMDTCNHGFVSLWSKRVALRTEFKRARTFFR